MTAVDTALREFQGAWERAERPDLNAYLAEVPETDRDELAGRVADWLETAPSPHYPDAVRAKIAAEPLLVGALEAASLARVPMAQRLPTLRERAGLSLGQVAAGVISAFGLGGSADAARAEDYLTSLERGELDEDRLSRRLRDRLAEILDVSPGALAPMPAVAPSALFRAEGDVADTAADFEALAAAAFSPAPSEQPMDELDRLFRGGPEG